MRNILNKIVFRIYKKCEKYLVDRDVFSFVHTVDYDFDFWGVTDD